MVDSKYNFYKFMPWDRTALSKMSVHSDENKEILITPRRSSCKSSPLKSAPRAPLSLRSSPTRYPSRSKTYRSPRNESSKSSRPPTTRGSQRSFVDHEVLEACHVVIIGDAKCGKSSLVQTYLSQRPTIADNTTIFETYEKVINFNNCKGVKLQLWDFPGDEYFDRFRPLGYANAKGVLICFKLDQVDTLQSARIRWIPEVERHCPSAKKILVGIGSELRSDLQMNKMIPTRQYCENYALIIGCEYMECSLFSNRSYSKVFEKMGMMLNDDKKQGPLGSILTVPKTRTNTMMELQQSQSSPRRTSYRKRKHICALM